MGRGGWWLGYLLKPWCFYYLVGCLDGCKLAGVFRLCEQIPRYTHPLYEYRISSKRTKVSIFHTHIQNLSDTPPKFSQVTEVMNNQIPRRLWWLSYQSSQIIMFHQPRFPRTKVMSLPKSYLFWGPAQVFNDVCTQETHVAARPSVLTTSPWGSMLSAGHRAIVGSPGIWWTSSKNLGIFFKIERAWNIFWKHQLNYSSYYMFIGKGQKHAFWQLDRAWILPKKTWHVDMAPKTGILLIDCKAFNTDPIGAVCRKTMQFLGQPKFSWEPPSLQSTRWMIRD